eukprot:4510357-Pyramimonas_sp.AAC.1
MGIRRPTWEFAAPHGNSPPEEPAARRLWQWRECPVGISVEPRPADWSSGGPLDALAGAKHVSERCC